MLTADGSIINGLVMARTALCEKLASAGGVIGEYAGAETALSFGDARREYLALRTGCAVYDLGWRATITVTGNDRTRWLNGMVSNNMRDLPAGRGAYNFVLNPQGHILGDLYAWNRGEDFLLSVERAQAEGLLALFQRYIIMDKVELSDVSDKLTGVGVRGPKAPEVLAAAGFGVSRIEPLHVEDAVWRGLGVSVTRMASDDFLAYEIWAASENISALWDALVAAGATPAGTDALEMLRVAVGVPRYGQDIRERDLPQETGQMRALNFSKGCYLGQEIVERIRSRGAVHRKLTGFVVENGAPAPGDKLLREGKEVGELTSVLAVPAANGERTLALGYVRLGREASEPGTILSAGGAQVRVEELPFKEN